MVYSLLAPFLYSTILSTLYSFYFLGSLFFSFLQLTLLFCFLFIRFSFVVCYLHFVCAFLLIVLYRSQMTCLMLAARDGYSKVINLLVSHGAEINTQDCNGYTVCHSWCFYVIASPISQDHVVAQKSQSTIFFETFRWPLLYSTLYMMSRTDIFSQALSIAVQYGREEAVLKLLQLGADKTIRTKKGKSPADLSVIFKHTQVPWVLFMMYFRPCVHAVSYFLLNWFNKKMNFAMKLTKLKMNSYFIWVRNVVAI